VITLIIWHEELVMKPYALTIKDTQRALGLGRTTLYELLAAGRLRRLKVGRRTLVTVHSIELLVEQAANDGAN